MTIAAEKKWTREAAAALKGRTIADVRYMDAQERSDLGWSRRAIVLVLDNGMLVWPSADDEGNEAGALFTTFDELPTIPVMGR
jgi:hypothetical protein